MKLYDAKLAPNCRRVRIFLAEKGLDIPSQAIAITKGEQFSDVFVAKNPLSKIPVLELDDGCCISESGAICEFIEDLHPQPSLIGETPQQRAQTRMWDRRIELEFFTAVMGAFQHTSPYFKNRHQQIPAYAEICRNVGWKRLTWLNEHLAATKFLTGDRFMVADITLMCALDFAAMIGEGIGEDEFPAVVRWQAEVHGRASANA